jgi:hypothetical protein
MSIYQNKLNKKKKNGNEIFTIKNHNFNNSNNNMKKKFDKKIISLMYH